MRVRVKKPLQLLHKNQPLPKPFALSRRLGLFLFSSSGERLSFFTCFAALPSPCGVPRPGIKVLHPLSLC